MDPSAILLTPDDACRRLNVGRTTMFELLRSGEIGSVKIGRLRRIPSASVDIYVARLTKSAQRIDFSPTEVAAAGGAAPHGRDQVA